MITGIGAFLVIAYVVCVSLRRLAASEVVCTFHPSDGICMAWSRHAAARRRFP